MTEATERKAGISQADIKRVATWGAGLLLTGAVGFAHGTLWAHESDIAVLKSSQAAMLRAQEASDRRFERIEMLLQEMLKEMRK